MSVLRLVTLASLPLVALAGPLRMDAPSGDAIETRVLADRVVVTSPWWQLAFDRAHGGVLSSISFPHGSGRNLLLEPWSTYVDTASDAASGPAQFRSWSERGVQYLEFRGTLPDGGGTGFRTLWSISPFAIRADHTLQFASARAVRRLGVGSTRFRAELNEYGLRTGPDHDSSKLKGAGATYARIPASTAPFIDETHAPVLLFFFARGVEGFDLSTASDLATWESRLASRPGLGRFQAQRTSAGIRLLREPLSSAEPVRVAAGDYTFSYYLGLPHVVERSNRRWRHMAIWNRPWPTDDEIRQWAEDGVNLLRIHNDFADDGNFWRDGAWPPYDARGMAEMRRVIATCHRYRIQVVPYFSLKEFHPEAAGYQANEAAWKRSIGPLKIIHNTVRKGEYGAQMCLESGWLERRKQDVERAFRELGFDGIYYDWVANQACDNPAHRPYTHLDTDALIDMLAWTRRLLAPTSGPLVLHLSGWFESIAMENYADLVVNLEEFSSKAGMMDLESIPVAGFQAEVLPRSPCPTYRPDKTVERSRNNTALSVVLGLFPHALPTSPSGVETLRLFRAFKPYALEQFRFRSVYTGAVTTAADRVYGALYTSPALGIAIVSNTTPKAVPAISWRLRAAELGFTAARYRVRDTTTGETREVPASALVDGSLGVSLGAYEYRLLEIRPVGSTPATDAQRGQRIAPPH